MCTNCFCSEMSIFACWCFWDGLNLFWFTGTHERRIPWYISHFQNIVFVLLQSTTNYKCGGKSHIPWLWFNTVDITFPFFRTQAVGDNFFFDVHKFCLFRNVTFCLLMFWNGWKLFWFTGTYERRILRYILHFPFSKWVLSCLFSSLCLNINQ